MKSAAPKLPGRHCYEDYDIAMKSAAPKLQGAAARMPFGPGLRPPWALGPWAQGQGRRGRIHTTMCMGGPTPPWAIVEKVKRWKR